MAQTVRSRSVGHAPQSYIGYSAASEVALEALATGRAVYEPGSGKKTPLQEQLDEICGRKT